ncbi:YobH family protein [Escherichia albertii]|uniref:YobH family protein n=1 Tax=Escherichia albertii TaxID=208962 RepID=UPI0034E52398
MQALPFWKVSAKHNCTALKERNKHFWYVSNVNFFHGILLKTKEVGVKRLIVGLAVVAFFIFSASTGYGVRFSSSTINDKIECRYISVSGKFSRNYWYSDNGIMGISNCPLFDR